MTPYYDEDGITIYHTDCREITEWLTADVLVTDPPYPNNAGHFDDDVGAARSVVASRTWAEALVFWTELEFPPVLSPPVAVHIWHRTNVNGRPYEPIFHFATDARKRRSHVLRHAAVFGGAGPGCAEYLGHPTQKPVVLMRRLIELTSVGKVITDPFMGSGSTLRAAKDLGRKAIGVERDERYCEVAAKRLGQGVLAL